MTLHAAIAPSWHPVVIIAALAFPAWIRFTHLLDILFITFMMRSGIQILASLPKLYWNEHCTPGTELLKFTRKKMPTDRLWISLDEEASPPSWLALPGGHTLGLGRHWHFAVAVGWILTGATYWILLFATGEWRRIVPTSWAVFPDALHQMIIYLSLRLPADTGAYNALQQLSYFSIVFLVAPIAIATGAAMSPALIGRFPWYLRIFGGRQLARTIHFGCLAIFVAFGIVHTVMVVRHGLPTEFARMALGSAAANHSLALFVGFAALAGVVLVHVLATWSTNQSPRTVQRMLGIVVDPLQRLLSHAVRSHQAYSRAEISPHFRVNGYPPKDPTYTALVESGFQDFRLEVGGLVEQPLSLGLDEIRKMTQSSQITKHNCIQGWSGVAEWSGLPLATLLEACRPLPAARYAVFHAFDNKSETHAEHEAGAGYFYEVVDLRLLQLPQTILAYNMNGAPLAVEHGAPLRLRVEVQLGFKMVKWVRSVELVDGYKDLGQGQGGWREDNAFYSQAVGI